MPASAQLQWLCGLILSHRDDIRPTDYQLPFAFIGINALKHCVPVGFLYDVIYFAQFLAHFIDLFLQIGHIHGTHNLDFGACGALSKQAGIVQQAAIAGNF